MKGLIIEAMAGLVGLAVGLGFSYIIGMPRKRKSRIIEMEAFKMKAREILRDVCEKTSAENGLLLRIHDGDGELFIGKQMYGSVIVEAVDRDNEMSAINSWDKVPIDEDYSKLVTDLAHNKQKITYTDNLPSDSLLKGVYMRRGVVASVLLEAYDISATGKSYFFISFPIRRFQNGAVDEVEMSYFSEAKHKVMNLCRDFHKLGVVQ